MAKTKKKASQMSAEEFLEHGLDSDVSDIECMEETLGSQADAPIDTKVKSKKVKKKLKSESATHKNQMDNLKEKDPEFFKFLQENDQELLQFSGTDDEGGSDGDENETEDDADFSDDNEGLNGKSDDDDDDGEDMSDNDEPEEEEIVPKGKVVTTEMVKKWKESLQTKSLKTLKQVLIAFHASVENLSPDESLEEEKKKKKKKYVVEGGTLFNNLVALCFKYSVPVLEDHLKYTNEKKSKRSQLPTSSNQWGKCKVIVKQYLLDVLQLLRQLTDPTVLTITLRHCQILCPYYACFPKITKMLLKRLVRMWSSGDEHVRVIAFLCIRKVTMLLPSLFEYSLKNLYLGFVRNTKFVNIKTRPTVMFMRNSLVEMFSLNEAATYRHAFVYIRQLAIHLRNAMTVKKKDGYQSVYNWQYLSCLQLWIHTLAELYGDVLKPLVYPVVQITLGVIRLIPAARYYPIRFQCIESLNYLCEKTGVYLPIASYLLEAIESKEFLKKPKSSEKPPDFTTLLKLSKTQLQTKGFQDGTIDKVFQLLLDHYVNISNSIAFPEVIFPVCHRLKYLVKSCKVFKLCKDMKMLVDKLQSHAEIVNRVRAQVSFSPKDTEDVRRWESEQKKKKNTLNVFYETWTKMNPANTDEHGEEQPIEELKNKGKRKSEPEVDKVKQTVPVPKKKKKLKHEETKKVDDEEEDIVEDFLFSSDEEDQESDG